MQDLLSEKKVREVVLNIDDIRNVREFFKHFRIEVAPELEDAMAAWEAKDSKVSLQDQEALKIGLCVSMLKSSHPMFKDPLFEKILKKAEKLVYESTFAKELETQLGSEDK